jgi:hypothetical protein
VLFAEMMHVESGARLLLPMEPPRVESRLGNFNLALPPVRPSVGIERPSVHGDNAAVKLGILYAEPCLSVDSVSVACLKHDLLSGNVCIPVLLH